MLREFTWLAISGGGGTVILATQASHGAIEVVPAIAVLGTFLTLASIAFGKMWSIISEANSQLKEIAKQAREAEKAVRQDNIRLERRLAEISNTMGKAVTYQREEEN